MFLGGTILHFYKEILGLLVCGSVVNLSLAMLSSSTIVIIFSSFEIEYAGLDKPASLPHPQLSSFQFLSLQR